MKSNATFIDLHPRNSSLFLILVLFCIEFSYVFNKPITGIIVSDLPLALILDGLFVIALLHCLWWLTRFMRHESYRVTLFYNLVLLGFIFSIGTHAFFLQTRTVVDIPLVYYLVRNFADLLPLLVSGINIVFFLEVLLGLLALATIIYLSRKQKMIFPGFLVFYFVVMTASWTTIAVLTAPIQDSQYRKTYVYKGVAWSWLNTQNRITLASIVAVENLHQVYQDTVILEVVAERPNIIFIVLESMRYDAFASVQETLLRKGDTFARQVFGTAHYANNLYTTVSHTSKALIGMHCGIFPHPIMDIIEASQSELPFDCAPSKLQELGYSTAHMQTALGTFEDRPQLAKNLGFQHIITGEDFAGRGYQKLGYFGLDDKALIPETIDWIKQQEQPYFAHLLTVGTHHPYESPGADFDAGMDPHDAYAVAVAYTSSFLIDFFAALEREVDTSNTVIMLVSDHGEGFGENGPMQHDMVPYQDVVHTPALIWWSGRDERFDDHLLRTHLDIYSTIMGFVSTQWEGGGVGKSLLDETGHEQIYSLCWYTYSCMSMVRSDGIKAIYNFGNGSFEIYDIVQDPQEKNNLRNNYSDDQIAEDFKHAMTLKLSMDKLHGIDYLKAK